MRYVIVILASFIRVT